MNSLIIVAAIVILVLGVMLFEMLRVPAGIERERRIKQRKIFSRTRTLIDAPLDEVIRLLQGDWSWWKKAHAEKTRDLGDGRREFLFHPIRFLDLIEVQPVFLVRIERTETLPDAGIIIHATLTGDFDGRAEYAARPGPGGTIVELAWCGVEVRSVFRFAPIALVASIHCWRERVGVEGLRDRLKSRRSGA